MKLSMEDFEAMLVKRDSIQRFNKHHKTSYTSWMDILSYEWFTQLENTDKIRYRFYLKWYNRNCTKLGRALK